MKNLIRKILKESEDDGLDWIREVVPDQIRSINDIQYFLGREFKLYDTVTGSLDSTLSVDGGVYWLEDLSDHTCLVCWRWSNTKRCQQYPTWDIVNKFNGLRGPWTWKFT